MSRRYFRGIRYFMGKISAKTRESAQKSTIFLIEWGKSPVGGLKPIKGGFLKATLETLNYQAFIKNGFKVVKTGLKGV